MDDPSKERRFKILMLNDDLILSLLFEMTKKYPQFIKLPELKGLPTDVEILTVGYELSSRRFEFLIAHKSFDRCPVGVTFPRIDNESFVIDLKQYKPVNQ